MTFAHIVQIIFADPYVRQPPTDHRKVLMEDVFWFLQLHARQCSSIFHFNNVHEILRDLATSWTVVWYDHMPRQVDGVNCGPLTVTTMLYFCQGIAPYTDVPWSRYFPSAVVTAELARKMRQWMAGILLTDGSLIMTSEHDVMCLLKDEKWNSEAGPVDPKKRGIPSSKIITQG